MNTMEIVKIILMITASLALVGLFYMLVKLGIALKNVNDVLKENRFNITSLMTSTASIVDSINDRKDDLEETIVSINNITTDVEVVTGKATDLLNKGEETMLQTKKTMQNLNKFSGIFNKKGDRNVH